MKDCISPNSEKKVIDVWDLLDEWFEQKIDSLTCRPMWANKEL